MYMKMYMCLVIWLNEYINVVCNLFTCRYIWYCNWLTCRYRCIMYYVYMKTYTCYAIYLHEDIHVLCKPSIFPIWKVWSLKVSGPGAGAPGMGPRYGLHLEHICMWRTFSNFIISHHICIYHILYHRYYILYIVYSIFNTKYQIRDTIWCISYTLHSMLYTISYIIYTMYKTLETL